MLFRTVQHMSTRSSLRPSPELPTLVAERGIDAVADLVDQFVIARRCDGDAGLLLDIVADRTQPAVARERAFGRLWGTVPCAPMVSARSAA